MSVISRRVVPDDAADYLALLAVLDAENPYMTVSPGERLMTVKEQRSRFDRLRPEDVLYMQWSDGRPVAYCGCYPGRHIKNRHVGRLVLASVKGRSSYMVFLLRRVLQDAAQSGVTRAEFTVVVSNASAMRFYQRLGAIIEGYRRCSFRLGLADLDEVYFAFYRGPTGFSLKTPVSVGTER